MGKICKLYSDTNFENRGLKRVIYYFYYSEYSFTASTNDNSKILHMIFQITGEGVFFAKSAFCSHISLYKADISHVYGLFLI